MISFSPGKKKCVEELLKSPVKIGKLRKGKYQNFILDEKSPIKTTALDYVLEDEEIHLGNLAMFGNGSLADFTIQVKCVEKEKMNKDRNPLQSVIVSDKYGSTKLFLYVRLVHDTHGGVSTLMTPKEGCVIERATDFTGVDMIDPSVKGEICAVDFVSKYPTCMKCNKKIQNENQTQKTYDCANPKCKTRMKKKFANTGIFVKFMFISEDKRKYQMTIFQDELYTLIPNASTMSEDQIKERLLDFDEMKICINNNNIVTEATVV